MSSREDPKVLLAKQFLDHATRHVVDDGDAVTDDSLTTTEALAYARTLALVSIAESLRDIYEYGLAMTPR